MSDQSPERSRRLGVEFGDLDDALASHSYPASDEELVEAYGDYEVRHPSGSQTFEDVLGVTAATSYRSADAVRRAVLTFVGEGAVGRKYYSDRTPPVAGEWQFTSRETF